LAETGKWNEARTVLEKQLSETKDLTEIARLKAELAHCSVTTTPISGKRIVWSAL
jgi:hypothetical protein